MLRKGEARIKTRVKQFRNSGGGEERCRSDRLRPSIEDEIEKKNPQGKRIRSVSV